MFYKKVVPLNFGFDSLGNEQNFLSNQKAGELMNVTRNKLSVFETKQKIYFSRENRDFPWQHFHNGKSPSPYIFGA